MNVLEKPNVVQPAILELQAAVKTEMAKTVIEVMTNILMTLMASNKVAYPEFVQNEVVPRQAALSQIDERTSKFFQKMMGAINEQLNQLKGIPESFMKLTAATQDQHIRKKIVEGIALPSVEKLIKTLDGIKPSIIDDIILD